MEIFGVVILAGILVVAVGLLFFVDSWLKRGQRRRDDEWFSRLEALLFEVFDK